MKILFIFHNASLTGGAPLSGLTLIKGLRDSGHEVHAVCPAECELSQQLRKENFNTIIIDYRSAWQSKPHGIGDFIKYIPRTLRNRLVNRKAVKKLCSVIDSLKPDIVHSNSSVIDVGARCARICGLPHVTHFREYGTKDTNCIMWHIPSILRQKNQYNIAISRRLANFRGLDISGNSRVIYNGVIPDTPTRINPAPSHYFLYAGQLHKAKGIHHLIEAYAALPEKIRDEYQLLLAGSANDECFLHELSDFICRKGVSSQVRLLGHRKDVTDLMYGATALIVPSLQEAFGRIIPEAMANGCIVAGNDCAGIKEQFDNGREFTGKEIALRFHNVNQLTEILVNLANAQYVASLGEMRQCAAATARHFYSIESYVSAVGNFYKDIVK